MAENLTEVVAGAVTLAVAVGFAIYAGQASDLSLRGPETYPLSASFRSVEGVEIGSDVRLGGVRIGTVTGLALNADTYRADMALRIDRAIALPEDSSIAISSEGLLGGTFVEIVPGGSPFMLEPGGEIEDTQGALSLLGLLAKFVSSSGSQTQ